VQNLNGISQIRSKRLFLVLNRTTSFFAELQQADRVQRQAIEFR
jgi:hypothetical protein